MREVKRFGDEFVCRELDSEADWESITLDDITPDELLVITDLEARLERIRTRGFDPEQERAQFAKIIRAGDPENTATNGD